MATFSHRRLRQPRLVRPVPAVVPEPAPLIVSSPEDRNYTPSGNPIQSLLDVTAYPSSREAMTTPDGSPITAVRFVNPEGTAGLASLPLTPGRFGARMDGVTDDTAAFEALMAAAAETGQSIHLGDGHAILSRQINVPTDIAVSYGHCTLDWSAATFTDPAFPQRACLHIGGDAPVQIGDLAVDAAPGDRTLTFAAPPTLADGDVILIWNPTASSYSAFRPYYRASEMCPIHKIVGNVATLYSPVYASYAAATVNVYRLSRKTSSFNGGKLTIIGCLQTGVSYGIFWRYLHTPTMQNIEAYNVNMQCFTVDACWGARGSNLCSRQSFDTSATGYSDYGLALSHCQNARFKNLDLSAYKHAFTSGGGLDDPACINRDFEVEGTFSILDETADTIGSVSAHGNSEWYHMSGQFNGGVQLGGNHGKFSGRVRNRVGDRTGISLAEPLGFDFDCSNLIVDLPASNPHVDARSAIDINGNGSAIGSSMQLGGTLRLNGVRINAPVANRLFEAFNNGYVGSQKLIIDMRGMHIVAAGAVTGSVFITTIGGGSTDGFTLLLDSIVNEPQMQMFFVPETTVINPNGFNMRASTATAAATMALSHIANEFITVNGNATITTITLTDGQTRTLKFASNPTLTAGASLLIPGGTKVVTPNSIAVVRGLAGGIVQVTSYEAA